jgi:hypothetical protein
VQFPLGQSEGGVEPLAFRLDSPSMMAAFVAASTEYMPGPLRVDADDGSILATGILAKLPAISLSQGTVLMAC